MIFSFRALAVDLGSVIDQTLGLAGDTSTSKMSYAGIEFQLPMYYTEDTYASTEDQKIYRSADGIAELKLYRGDYQTTPAEFEENKKTVVTKLVAGMPDGTMTAVKESVLAGNSGLRFDFTSIADGKRYMSYGGYYYNAAEEEYLILLLSVPQGANAAGYLNHYETMIGNAVPETNDISMYTDVVQDIANLVDAFDREDYGNALNRLADLYNDVTEIED